MKTILLVVIALQAWIARAQDNTIDSLHKILNTGQEDTNKVNTLNLLCDHLWRMNDGENTLKYAIQAQSLAEKLHLKKGARDASMNIGEAYYLMGDYPEASNAFKTALQISKEMGDKKGMAYAYRELSFTGESFEMLDNLFASLKIYREIDDKQGMSACYQYLSRFYLDEDDKEQALKYLFAGLQIREQLGEKAGVSQTLNSIGEIYTRQGRFQEALQKHLAALKIAEELGNNGPAWVVGYCYRCLGEVYLNQGEATRANHDDPGATKNYTEALKYYNMSLNEWEKNKDQTGIIEAYLKIGHVNTMQRQFNKAGIALQTGLKTSLEMEWWGYTSTAYFELYQLDSSLQNHKQAFEYYKLYTAYRDSTINQENVRKLEQVKMRHKFEERESAAKAAQEKRDTMAAAEIKNQKLIRNLSLTGGVVIISFGGLSFYRYRRRRKLQSEQEMLNERLRISRELHDDIGSTLGSISIYSEVAKNRSPKNENANEAIAKIGVASRELIGKMSDIVWSINPNNESFEQLQNRMQAFAAITLTPRNIQNDFVFDEELKNIQLTTEERKNMFLIFKDAVHNIVRYADCSRVETKLSIQNGQLEMLIKDDGKGFDSISPGQVYNGNSLKNMKARADDINAVLDIHSVVNEGTTIKLVFDI